MDSQSGVAPRICILNKLVNPAGLVEFSVENTAGFLGERRGLKVR